MSDPFSNIEASPALVDPNRPAVTNTTAETPKISKYAPGAKVRGYEFKGGDYRDKANWMPLAGEAFISSFPDLDPNTAALIKGIASKAFPSPDLTNPKNQELVAMARRYNPSFTTVTKKPTPAQLAVDKAFAKDYVEWTSGGGSAGIKRQLETLTDATKTLGSSNRITGPIVGRLPKFAQQVAAPAAVDVKADVEQTIQQSLKNILGGAFTQAEATGLIERAYDPTQPEASNIRRVNRAIKELEERAAVKENLANYYEINGTTVGWKNPNPRFKNVLPTPTSSETKLDVPRDVDPKDWARLTPEERALWQ